jgi:hypothetical protein
MAEFAKNVLMSVLFVSAVHNGRAEELEAERRGKCIAIRLSVHKELNSRNASQSVRI